tara:strand:- start:931 stop:1158 length:228 start_codon:yes stop_codon:yes gene_type:complete
MMANKKRARTASGKFISDDPDTPNVNEAWITEAKISPEGTLVKNKSSTSKSSTSALPPKGSAQYKAMLLRGEIKE